MRISLLFTLIVTLFIFNSCTEDTDSTKDKIAIGGKYYGGVFKFMSSEKITTLLPISITDVYSSRIVSQIYEPLLKLNISTLEVEGCLAESFSFSNDAKKFTLKLRKGVFFHDDECFENGKGREVSAEDVKFSLELACSGLLANENKIVLTEKVKGAKEFAEKSKKTLPKSGVSGIKIINSSTIEIQLIESFVGFEKVLTLSALSILPKEAYDKYGDELKSHPVGTGAFKLESLTKDKITLVRNSNYWGKDELGNQLPFLDRVEMTYYKDKKEELLAFRKQEIDVVLDIPVDNLKNVFGSLENAHENVKHKIETESSLKMVYLAFDCESKEFKDERIRKAFNLAVNKQGIIDNILDGEGYPANKGFVPNMESYSNEKISGNEFNPELAKSFLSQAGFPNGKNFPIVDIYVNTTEGTNVYKLFKGVVADLKANLNIKINIKMCTLQERIDGIASGKIKMWKAGWVADYPDAENFLTLFYSKNIGLKGATAVNSYNFKNLEFDDYYSRSLKEINKEKRSEYLLKCDQLLVDHAAVLPLLTDDFVVMVNVRVRDFKTNSLQFIDFSTLYIKKKKK
jgi:peptide/nickel transport system substrate-binding protein